jgi:hypothetical protein
MHGRVEPSAAAREMADTPAYKTVAEINEGNRRISV